jgi:Phytanoyl-CoA dioxygenase (PhyH)
MRGFGEVSICGLSLVLAVTSAFIISPSTTTASPSRWSNYFYSGSGSSSRQHLVLPQSSSPSAATTTAASGGGQQAARDLLYADQQRALESRSKFEEGLLRNNTSLLTAPPVAQDDATAATTVMQKKKKKQQGSAGGIGFGGGKSTGLSSSQRQQRPPHTSKNAQAAAIMADILRRDGVIRIDNVLAGDTADRLLGYVLEQQQWAADHATAATARTFYGVEQARTARCDLQLSLLRGGYARDHDNGTGAVEESAECTHVLADVLQELLGVDGSLRQVYQEVVTLQGEFYELAAVVTNTGSARQVIHPDLPYRDQPPLYVVFLALQDVTEDMGPTSYLLGTHRLAETAAQFMDPAQKDDLLRNADCRLSLLNKGDAVVFDARILHCGNANVSGNTRALFNFSFRNPKVTGDLGYAGSIRPGYCQQMTLQDVADALLQYERGVTADPFQKYGPGLL